ncbi:MAG: hypothetical protein ACJAX3_002713 [Patiriisocius sp.]|jgi:hypothetical protein
MKKGNSNSYIKYFVTNNHFISTVFRTSELAVKPTEIKLLKK